MDNIQQGRMGLSIPPSEKGKAGVENVVWMAYGPTEPVGPAQHRGKCCWRKTEGRSSTWVQTPDPSTISPVPSNPFPLPTSPIAMDWKVSALCTVNV